MPAWKAATLTNCTVSDNTATDGGGLFIGNVRNYARDYSTATLTNCTVSGNSASDDGGGLDIAYGLTPGTVDGTATLTSCTVSGNSATSSGGGLYIGGAGLASGAGTATLTNCTVSGNSGAGLYLGPGESPGVANLSNTIVAAQTSGADIGSHGIDSLSGNNNLIGDGSGQIYGTGNLLGSVANPINPLLAPLGNYGGPAPTMALLPGSPALGKALIVNYPGTTTQIKTDERGMPLDSPKPDIGAFQSQGFTLTAASGSTPQVALPGTPFTLPLALTVTANNPAEPVAAGVITWSAPSTGPSAVLSSTTSTIGAGGVASVTATAGSTLGSYLVTASARGVATPASFELTNTLQLAVT